MGSEKTKQILTEELQNVTKKPIITKTKGDYPNGKWERWIMRGGKVIRYETSDGYWAVTDYDLDGNDVHWEDSEGFWYEAEYDENGKQITFKDSLGVVEDYRDEIQEQLVNVVKKNRNFSYKIKCYNDSGELIDSEECMWASAMEEEMKYIERETHSKFKIIDIQLFDQYQGPYVIIDVLGKKYKLWNTGDESMNTWFIEGFPINNGGAGEESGYAGTTHQIVRMIKSYNGKKQIQESLVNVKKKEKSPLFAFLDEYVTDVKPRTDDMGVEGDYDVYNTRVVDDPIFRVHLYESGRVWLYSWRTGPTDEIIRKFKITEGEFETIEFPKWFGSRYGSLASGKLNEQLVNVKSKNTVHPDFAEAGDYVIFKDYLNSKNVGQDWIDTFGNPDGEIIPGKKYKIETIGHNKGNHADYVLIINENGEEQAFYFDYGGMNDATPYIETMQRLFPRWYDLFRIVRNEDNLNELKRFDAVKIINENSKYHNKTGIVHTYDSDNEIWVKFLGLKENIEKFTKGDLSNIYEEETNEMNNITEGWFNKGVQHVFHYSKQLIMSIFRRIMENYDYFADVYLSTTGETEEDGVFLNIKLGEDKNAEISWDPKNKSIIHLHVDGVKVLDQDLKLTGSIKTLLKNIDQLIESDVIKEGLVNVTRKPKDIGNEVRKDDIVRLFERLKKEYGGTSDLYFDYNGDIESVFVSLDVSQISELALDTLEVELNWFSDDEENIYLRITAHPMEADVDYEEMINVTNRTFSCIIGEVNDSITNELKPQQ